MLHNKALALAVLEDFDSAIQMWEGLSEHEIEGFNQNVKSELQKAKIDSTIQKAKQYEQNGNLEASIEAISEFIIQSPENEQLNQALKTALRKRRSGNTPEGDTYNISDTLDQLDLNHTFIIGVQNHIKNITL